MAALSRRCARRRLVADPGYPRAARVEENLGSLDVALTPEQLDTLDAAGAGVSGQRFADLSWVSAGRE